jgi:hypothetical protein
MKTVVKTTNGNGDFAMDNTSQLSADDVMLKRNPDPSGLSKLDEAIMWSRAKPLTDEELAAFGPVRSKPPRFTPYISVQNIRVEGKKKPALVIGIKGTF